MYKLVRRPPCWNSTARLARHARLDLLDWLDKVERVGSSRVEPSGIWALVTMSVVCCLMHRNCELLNTTEMLYCIFFCLECIQEQTSTPHRYLAANIYAQNVVTNGHNIVSQARVSKTLKAFSSISSTDKITTTKYFEQSV